MHWQCDDEGRPLPGTTLCGDLAAVALGDLAADRQTHAGPLVLVATVQSLEHSKDPVEIFHVKSDPVVFHCEPATTIAVGVSLERDHRLGVFAAEFQRVAD